jgi:hypothetical protein
MKEFMIYILKIKTNVLYLINSNYVTSLFPSFEIDDNNMIKNSNSALFFYSEFIKN